MRNPFKRVSKNKQQIIAEQKLMADTARQKRIVKDILYPILAEHSTSVGHAQQSCQVMKVVIMQAMQKPFKDKNVSELKLDEELSKEKDVKDRAMFEAFVSGFKDVGIADTLKMLDGFGGAIDGYIRQDANKKEFKAIPINEIVNE